MTETNVDGDHTAQRKLRSLIAVLTILALASAGGIIYIWQSLPPKELPGFLSDIGKGLITLFGTGVIGTVLALLLQTHLQNRQQMALEAQNERERRTIENDAASKAAEALQKERVAFMMRLIEFAADFRRISADYHDGENDMTGLRRSLVEFHAAFRIYRHEYTNIWYKSGPCRLFPQKAREIYGNMGGVLTYLGNLLKDVRLGKETPRLKDFASASIDPYGTEAGTQFFTPYEQMREDMARHVALATKARGLPEDPRPSALLPKKNGNETGDHFVY